MKRFQKALLATCVGLATTSAAADSVSEEIKALRERLQQLEQRLEATGARVDEVASNGGMREDYGTRIGKTSIGGYGELHYNNLENQKPGGGDKEVVDFHRFVLFLGHEFNEDVRMFSELEVEHALSGDDQPGEVELEQAYVEFDLSETTRARGGVFIVPVGILNETHEPPTFYGVERNPVEKQIIPTTWWEAGGMLSGEIAPGLAYDVAVHSGLDGGYNIRGGRQKVAKADADALAYTGRIRWTGIAGLELAATLNHQSDLNQGAGETLSGNLLETHAVYQSGSFGLRALYATWDLDDSVAADGRDRQTGWYVEPSYKVLPELGLFARYNAWDNAAGNSADSEYTQVDVGMNYWPHPDVVVKADYQDQSAPDGQSEYDGFNLGIGFQF